MAVSRDSDLLWDGSLALHGGLLFASPEAPRTDHPPGDNVAELPKPVIRRGRPPRAGEAATARIELRLTMAELRSLKKLATSNGSSVADLLRQAVCDLAEDSGQPGPMVTGRELLTFVR